MKVVVAPQETRIVYRVVAGVSTYCRERFIDTLEVEELVARHGDHLSRGGSTRRLNKSRNRSRGTKTGSNISRDINAVDTVDPPAPCCETCPPPPSADAVLLQDSVQAMDGILEADTGADNDGAEPELSSSINENQLFHSDF